MSEWPEERLESMRLIEQRMDAIGQATDPLPGSIPYENHRPLNVPLRYDHKSAIEFLCEFCPQVTSSQWLQRFELGFIRRNGQPVRSNQQLRAGDKIVHVVPETVEPDVNSDILVLYEDDSIVVLSKPAPLPMHPSGRFNRNSLVSILKLAFAPLELRVAHRLDANTTGIVLLSKTKEVAAALQPQFERGEIKKQYLAKILGTGQPDRFQCAAPISSVPTTTGARVVSADGLSALTEFETVQRGSPVVSSKEPDEISTSLVLASPVTGRTNQIRIHLWHLGWPIVGDMTYQTPGEIGGKQTIDVNDPPLCLHAWKIEFQHPTTGKRVEFESPQPPWAIGKC